MPTDRHPEFHKESSDTAESRLTQLRERMIREQLQVRGVRDLQVLEAMRKIPRHRFVPERLVEAAYNDNALPIAKGQTISQPYIVGYMTQTLDFRGGERVLEIGTGSGYQTAILAELAAEVFTVEIIPELADQARTLLDSLGYANIQYRCGDGYAGWPEAAPFDRILVTAAPEHIPQPLIDQLKPGGRMIIPVGRGDQELVLIEKTELGIKQVATMPVRFVPMTGAAQRNLKD